MRDPQLAAFLQTQSGFFRGLISSDKLNNQSMLSEILECGHIPARFFLSPLACRGILRRAEKRGKTLPAQLEAALRQVADSAPISILAGASYLNDPTKEMLKSELPKPMPQQGPRSERKSETGSCLPFLSSESWNDREIFDRQLQVHELRMGQGTVRQAQARPKGRIQAGECSGSLPELPSACDFEENTGIAMCLNGKGGSGRIDAESETFIASQTGPLTSNPYGDHESRESLLVAGPLQHSGKSDGSATQQDAESGMLITHALSADGFDASEDGTGRGTPIVVAFDSRQDCVSSIKEFGSLGSSSPQSQAIAFDTTQITSKTNRSNPQVGDPCHTLAKGAAPPALALNFRGREGGSQAELGDEVASSLRCGDGSSSKPHTLNGMQVRRITVLEAERLMGTPDYYTRIPVRWYKTRRITKLRPADRWEPAEGGGWWLMQADGPRYRQLGNSMAVPCISWIGKRIQAAMDGKTNGTN